MGFFISGIGRAIVASLSIFGDRGQLYSSPNSMYSQEKWQSLGLVRGGSTSSEDAQYSFSLTTFSPRGSLSQIEYAMNAVAAGALALAIKYNGGVVLASLDKAKSPLVRDICTKKISYLSDRISIVYAGLAADSRVLITTAHQCCSQYSNKFGGTSEMPVCALVSELASVMQEYTQMAGVRPFGVTLIVAGVDTVDGAGGANCDKQTGADCVLSEKNEVLLYRIDPSGRYSSWKAVAIGQGSSIAEELLEDRFKDDMLKEEAIDLAVSVVLSCTEGGTAREDVQVSVIEDRAQTGAIPNE